jgi:hypothetical protein
MRNLPEKARIKCLAYLTQLENLGHEVRRPVADYLRDGIFELRPSYQGVHYRILYFFSNVASKRVIVVSHGLVKEGVVPPAEIERAIERKKWFEAGPERHSFQPKR